MSSCNRCGSGFSLFKKENYCRNCGFAFCSGCLSKKISVPKYGTDSKHSVCHKCFTVLTSSRPEVNANNVVRSASPPAALQRRMDAIPRANNALGHANGSSKNGISDADKAIADRLANLRAERNAVPVPPLSHLEDRLAKLKGIPTASTSLTAQSNSRQPVAYQQTETRTYDEQIQDLLQQFTHRVDIDSRVPRPEDEIQMRLARLRSDDASLNDLNKASEPVQPAAAPVPTPAPPPPQQSRSPPSGNSDDDEMSRVWQYMLEAEQESLREMEEALRMQARDVELKKKLEEIKANRDTPKRRRGGSAGALGSGDLSDEDNEDKIADKVIKQFLSESMIDGCVGPIPSPPQPSKHKSSKRHKEEKLLNFKESCEPDDVEELPWCVICNEDASLRCYGCEGDLYCRRCFRECHSAMDVRDHKMGPFNSKTDLNHRTPSYIDSN